MGHGEALLDACCPCFLLPYTTGGGSWLPCQSTIIRTPQQTPDSPQDLKDDTEGAVSVCSPWLSPKLSSTSTGSTSNGTVQYSVNIDTTERHESNSGSGKQWHTAWGQRGWRFVAIMSTSIQGRTGTHKPLGGRGDGNMQDEKARSHQHSACLVLCIFFPVPTTPCIEHCTCCSAPHHTTSPVSTTHDQDTVMPAAGNHPPPSPHNPIGPAGTPVLSTTLALVRSVAVHSMNTSRVSREICGSTWACVGNRHDAVSRTSAVRCWVWVWAWFGGHADAAYIHTRCECVMSASTAGQPEVDLCVALSDMHELSGSSPQLLRR